MDFLLEALRFSLELNQRIEGIWAHYGVWLYVLVFAIVFAETGLVVVPWLPGDSLLFVLGALAAAGGPDITVLWVTLASAALLGNTSNYWIGWWIGPRVFHWPDSRWLSQKTLRRAHDFYEKYGAVTVIASRFLPVLRTFAPFVAGIGRMSHSRFQVYSVGGGLVWVSLFLGLGYAFGNVPWVKDKLSVIVLIGLVSIAIVPLAAKAWFMWRERKVGG
jgi:membrane-associated protein